MTVELPKSVREFLVRDLIYIIGGGCILVSFLYRFDRLPGERTPVAFYLLGTGVAYVLGCAAQDLFSIARFVTTGPVVKPGRFIRYIYRRFTGEQWGELKGFEPSEVRQAIRSVLKEDEARAAHYERAIGGMILATTMAPCTLICSGLVFWRALASCSGFDFALAGASLALSVGLFVLAWLKASQVTQIDAAVVADFRAASKPTGVDGDAQNTQ